MAVAVLVEVPGVTSAQYDAVMKDVFPGNHPPHGCMFHVAGPAEGVWRVVDVWDSQATFDAFVQNTLGPAMGKAGITAHPDIKSWPVHNTTHSH
jgi:hypothetical protein